MIILLELSIYILYKIILSKLLEDEFDLVQTRSFIGHFRPAALNQADDNIRASTRLHVRPKWRFGCRLYEVNDLFIKKEIEIQEYSLIVSTVTNIEIK